MADFDDVGTLLGQCGGDQGQGTRGVARAHPQSGQALRAHHAPLDGVGQRQRVDVAAAEHQAYASSGKARPVVQHRCQAGGAGPLDDGLLDLEQGHQRLVEALLGHQADLVDLRGDQGHGQRTGKLHGDAVGDGGAAPAGAVRMAARCVAAAGCAQRAPGGRIALGLHADDADAGGSVARGHRHAGDQSAAAHGQYQQVQVGTRIQHLQRDGALAGHGQRVVIGMDDAQSAFAGELEHPQAGRIEGVAFQQDLRPECFGVLDLHEGREARHDDGGRDAQALRMPGHALGVVARGHCDHAAAARLGVQPQQTVQGAALLEGGGELQVLELEVELTARQRRQRA